MQLLTASNLQIIRQNPLEKLRTDYQDFFCSRTGLTLDEVQEKPEILDIIGDSDFDDSEYLPFIFISVCAN
jgi:hypothetical protein